MAQNCCSKPSRWKEFLSSAELLHLAKSSSEVRTLVRIVWRIFTVSQSEGNPKGAEKKFSAVDFYAFKFPDYNLKPLLLITCCTIYLLIFHGAKFIKVESEVVVDFCVTK